MRFLPLVLVALLVACAPPNSNPGSARLGDDTDEAPEASTPTGFDPQAWLAEARGLAFDPEADDYDDAKVLRMKALAAELDEAVGWGRACDTYLDYETGAPVYEPTPNGEGHWVRGTLDVGPISDTEAAVAITCDFGAYQGSYALVRIAGDRAMLLSAPALGEDGQPMGQEETTFSTPGWDRLSDGLITTFGLARGLGDCGTLTTYALTGTDDLDIREVRQRDCGDDIPDPLPPPEEWPVVYSAE